ncbi:MAG: Lrp/AsnC ligand binding domain-containing protein [Aigarchaeota archaeon]|nr:Lrp/AsnC ligand binding domain-containing protein [Aigarchaeota archaeon]MDH5703404.1 Lrp/AsnC ligand binding domain-containing protein [Aigarchaeota archaeon]
MTNVCILIRVLRGKGLKVLNGLKKLPQVKSAHLVLGRYDVVAFAETRTYKAVAALSLKVNAIEGIKSSETLVEVA